MHASIAAQSMGCAEILPFQRGPAWLTWKLDKLILMEYI
jgi:hypothetical protein